MPNRNISNVPHKCLVDGHNRQANHEAKTNVDRRNISRDEYKISPALIYVPNQQLGRNKGRATYETSIQPFATFGVGL